MCRAILVAVTFCWATATADAAELSGSVDKIADGDTFWICDTTACQKIRLCGIDAPEKGEPGFEASTDALSQLIHGKPIRCVQVGDGTPCDGRSKPTNHDRIVAQCFADDIDSAATLVKQDFACDWVKFSGGAYSHDGNGGRCKGRRR